MKTRMPSKDVIEMVKTKSCQNYFGLFFFSSFNEEIEMSEKTLAEKKPKNNFDVWLKI